MVSKVIRARMSEVFIVDSDVLTNFVKSDSLIMLDYLRYLSRLPAQGI